MAESALAGVDLVATAIVLVDTQGVVCHANPSAENLFELSNKIFVGRQITDILHDEGGLLQSAIAHARAHRGSYTEHHLRLGVVGHSKHHLSCTVTPIEFDEWQAGWDGFILEFRHIDQQLQVAREERLLDQNQANRELIRNLAHEIKNPLGGIRGAAQLLDRELERPGLHEYTQVIIKESDRLQSLMDRLLTPHRLPQPALLNIHEVIERVRSLILAEYPQDIEIRRDYDVSMPMLKGDKEQLIQVVLNIVRNAAQAMQGKGRIVLSTRITRQVTLARKRCRLALRLQINDNGPGISEELREKIFYPLVSGREGGSGLGLTLAQTFIAQHHGAVTFDSEPGNTVFTVLLPIEYEHESEHA